MSEIPETIRAEARKAIYDTGRGMIGRERNYLEDRVCRALLAAEKRGKEEAAKELADLREEKAHLLEIGSKAIAFRVSDGITVESRGLGVWAISNGSAVYNTHGEWEYEPRPSNRDDEFIARTRYSFADAMMRAAAIRGS